jgi:hypothetical protein
MFGGSFIFVAIATIGLIFFVRTDAPKYYTAKGDEEGALEAIKTIYNTEGSQIQANKIMRFIQKSTN